MDVAERVIRGAYELGALSPTDAAIPSTTAAVGCAGGGRRSR